MISNSIKRLLGFLMTTTGAITLLSATAWASIPEGTWLSECRDGVSKIQVISEDHQSQTIERFYRDRLCEQASFEFITNGNLDFPVDSKNQINFTYTQIQLTIHIDEVIRDFNERAVCGLNDWKKSEPQTITGLNCALFNIHKPTPVPRVADTRYGIYKIEADKLYYGQLSIDFDGSTPQKRPQTYDRFFYLRSF